MNQKADPTPQREYELGLAFGGALRQVTDKSARSRLALLLDLLGDDRALLAPLRHMVESPNFQELINESSGAARTARQETLLSELSAWCNRETLERLEAFLAGAFAIPLTGRSWTPQNHDTLKNSAGPPNPSANRHSPISPQKATDDSKSTNIPPNRDNSNNLSSEERITILQEKARAATLSGNNQEAVKLLTDALQLDPAKASLYMQRGSLYAKSQDTGSAIRDFTSVLRLEPNNINALAQRGQVHALLGDTEKAISDWEKSAIAGHDESKKWISSQLVAEAKEMIELKQYHKSLESLEKANHFSPLNSEAYTIRGQAFQALAYHGVAISAFNRAISLDPHNANAFALVGQSYKQMGNDIAALSSWRTAVKLGCSEAKKWISELEESHNHSTSAESSKPPHSNSPSPKTDASASSEPGIPGPVIGALAGLFLLIGFATIHIDRHNEPPPETTAAGSASGTTDHTFIENRLATARSHDQAAALICEHQKVIDAFDGADFSSATQAQLDERNNLLSKAKAAIKNLDAPGKNRYWEDCQNGVGLQEFDDYKWEYGKDFIKSLFVVASKKCLDPAIQVNVFANEKLTNRKYSEWISFAPDPGSMRTAKITFRIPASKLPSQGPIWLDYKARCNI